jgi:hypothetical protein
MWLPVPAEEATDSDSLLGQVAGPRNQIIKGLRAIRRSPFFFARDVTKLCLPFSEVHGASSPASGFVDFADGDQRRCRLEGALPELGTQISKDGAPV